MLRILFLSSALSVTCLGAGCNRSVEPDGPANGGDSRPLAPDDLPAAEARLAELEKEIAGSEEKLAGLKAEAANLRSQIGAAKSGASGKVYTRAEDLFADMPADAYPKFGPEGGIERAAARKWANENLVGRTVEWQVTVKSVDVGGDGPFRVVLITEELSTFQGLNNPAYGGGDSFFAFGPKFSLGGQDCRVFLDTRSTRGFDYSQVLYPACTAEEAKVLRAAKGKKVTLQATIRDVSVNDKGYTIVAFDTTHYEEVPFILHLDRPSVDGLLPEADKLSSPK
jgi:hypothetical protein